jgi:hypothetical protein
MELVPDALLMQHQIALMEMFTGGIVVGKLKELDMIVIQHKLVLLELV